MLTPRGKGASLDESRFSAFPVRDFDRIEVLGNDRVREYGARLARELGAEVAAREVRQREQLDARRAGELSGLERRRVGGLARPLTLLVGERRLVDEHVGLVRGREDGRRGRGVAAEHDLPPRALGAE